jgi:hypothetical protein
LAAWVTPSHWRTRLAQQELIMRTLWTCLVGVIISILSMGIPAAVLAQTGDAAGPTCTYVSGVEVGAENFESAQEWHLSGGLVRQQVGVLREMAWSDPRLPSLMYERMLWDEYLGEHPEGLAEVSPRTLAYRLEGTDGTWTGTGRDLGWRQAGDVGPGMRHTILAVLTGEGAFEGLTAALERRIEYRLEGEELEGEMGPFEGCIFEGPLPPFPEPVESVSA